jgi:hypothetical protein
MSESVSDSIVETLCLLIGQIVDESCGDYLSHDQAEKLRKVISTWEIDRNAG